MSRHPREQAPKQEPMQQRGWLMSTEEKSELWLCAKLVDKPHWWELQGIFSSEQKAEAACHNERYFIGMLRLDEELPQETFHELLGQRFPLA